MGRHSRPNAAHQARATTLKAATALGVAGTIAIGLHAALDGDKSVQARSDVSTQQDQAPHIDPAVEKTPSHSHVSPSESAQPKPISNGTDTAATPGGGDGTDAGDGGQRHATPATPESAPSKAASPKTAPTRAAPTPVQRDDQVTAEPSAPSRTTPTADPTTPSQRPDRPSPTPGEGNGRGKGLVGGLVDGVGDTLGGVLGGLGKVLGG